MKNVFSTYPVIVKTRTVPVEQPCCLLQHNAQKGFIVTNRFHPPRIATLAAYAICIHGTDFLAFTILTSPHNHPSV